MKRLLLVLILGAALASPSFAQPADPTNAPPQGPPPGGHHPPVLTQEEMQELHQAHDAALQANPDLAAQEKQLREQTDALHKQIEAAMVKIDPNVAPLIAKMDADRKKHGDHNGPPPPPPAN